jgi:hypothetical protein
VWLTPRTNTALAQKPFDLAHAPIPHAVITPVHDESDTRFFDEPCARTDHLECQTVVHIEVEMSSGSQPAAHGAGNARQIGFLRDVIERIEFAKDEVDWFRQVEIPHICMDDAQRQELMTAF